MILGIDTGGTFTDFVLLTQQDQNCHFQIHKVLSTPDSPERAILQGIREMGLEQQVSAGNLKIIHGSTVATNAVLEGKGVKTAFITNHGFKDLLTIGRQTRPQLYKLEMPPLSAPVSPEYCLETGGRVNAAGKTLEPVTTEDLERLLSQLQTLKPEAIAINLLFSFLDDSHEKTIESFLRERLNQNIFISRSSYVLPEYKEYERGIATWLNASLGPLVQQYLLRLKTATAPSHLSVMQSSGGTIDADQAATKAVNLLLSGPAGGLAAASFISRTLAEPRLITFDMGGTSTDVALIDGEIRLSSEGHIGAYPVAVPMVDMHTIGAGGGSIAYVDDGGLLQVGPRSAGAKPGPACYGYGGQWATVTDANLVLGRLLPEAFMGGKITLNKNSAMKAMQALGSKLGLTIVEVAEGIIKLNNEHMARALRVISVERGYDPTQFRLCCFGGAGGLHICELADALLMNKALVPVNAGVLSAMGMFLAPVERQLSRTHLCLLKDLKNSDIKSVMAELEAEALRQIQEEKTGDNKPALETSVDLRYQGQSATLNIPWLDCVQAEAEFHTLHARHYGHQLAADVELVSIRVAAKLPPPSVSLAKLMTTVEAGPYSRISIFDCHNPVPVFHRDRLCPDQHIVGPALITEAYATTLITHGWSAITDSYGNLMLEKGS